MTSPSPTCMDIDDINPYNMQPGVGSSAAPTTAEPTNTASRGLKAGMEFLESAMQSLEIQIPGQEQQQSWITFTETLNNSIAYAQEYAASKKPDRIEANTWLSEIDKLDDEMSMFIHEMGEGHFRSKEAFDLVDQMLYTRQEVLNLVDQSFELGQRFVKLGQQIEDSKQEDIYIPGLMVSFKEDEEPRDAIWDLKCLVEGHVDILETIRKKQVELLTCGSMLQAQLGSV